MTGWKRVVIGGVIFLFLLGCNLTSTLSGASGNETAPTVTVEFKGIVTETPVDPSLQAEQAGNEMEAQVITPQNAALLRQVGSTPLNNPYGLSWSFDSTRVGAVTQEGLLMFDAQSLQTIANVVVQQPVVLLDFSSETNLMATTGDQINIELRDVTTGEIRHTLQSQTQFFAAVFSPDGTRLAVPRVDEIAAEIWDVQSGQLLTTLTGFETAAPVYGISFSGDGLYLIWVSRGMVQVQEIATGQMGQQLSHEDFVGGTALASDGKTLAVATAGTVENEMEPFIQLWDATSGTDLGRIPSGEFISSSLDFSPDGGLLFAGRNNSVVVWELMTQQEIKVLGGHNDRVTSVSVSPDGRAVASAGADNNLIMWRVNQ